MGKITGWKEKKTDGMQIQAWESDEGGILQIVKTNEGYYIGLKKRGMTNFVWLMYAQTNSIAEKRAVRWMRAHPRG